jgi:hypothetical protein
LARPREVFAVLLAVGFCALAPLGCGGGDATTASKTATRAQAPRPSAQPEVADAASCGLGAFVGSLETLEKRLAAGLSYEQYYEEVSGTRAAYEKVEVVKQSLPCLNAAGAPAESALDRYIEAANVWRECRADPSCGTYTIEPRLQRDWRVATHLISEIR